VSLSAPSEDVIHVKPKVLGGECTKLLPPHFLKLKVIEIAWLIFMF
jgi:hypothetical protein